MEIDYNTKRNQLVIKEYGRHIQQMVEYAKQVEDPEKRQKAANTIVELMAYFNPELKNIEDYQHKLWDHLFIIANFDLDVKSPYPMPQKEQLQRKAEPLAYPKRYPKFLHLGKNIESLMNKAKEEQDEQKKQIYIHILIHCMKQAYTTWHKDNVQDDALRQELQSLTKNALLYEFQPEIKKFLQEDRGERQDRDFKKNDKFFGNKKKHKSKFGQGTPHPHKPNTPNNLTNSPNPNPNAHNNNQAPKNYNNSNSTNVSLALPVKKNKFRRYKP